MAGYKDHSVRKDCMKSHVLEERCASKQVTDLPPIAPLMAVSRVTSWPTLGVATGAFPPALF